jgi:hypothetical protein
MDFLVLLAAPIFGQQTGGNVFGYPVRFYGFRLFFVNFPGQLYNTPFTLLEFFHNRMKIFMAKLPRTGTWEMSITIYKLPSTKFIAFLRGADNILMGAGVRRSQRFISQFYF